MTFQAGLRYKAGFLLYVERHIWIAVVKLHQRGLDQGAAQHERNRNVQAPPFPVGDVIVLPVPLVAVRHDTLGIVQIALSQISGIVAAVPSVKQGSAQVVLQIF